MKYIILSYLIFLNQFIFAPEPVRPQEHPFDYNLEDGKPMTFKQAQRKALKEMSPQAKADREAYDQKAKLQEYKEVANQPAKEGARRLSFETSTPTSEQTKPIIDSLKKAKFIIDSSDDDEEEDGENERLAQKAKDQEAALAKQAKAQEAAREKGKTKKRVTFDLPKETESAARNDAEQVTDVSTQSSATQPVIDLSTQSSATQPVIDLSTKSSTTQSAAGNDAKPAKNVSKQPSTTPQFTWTAKNIENLTLQKVKTITPEDFKELKTADLVTLLKNSEIVEKLSIAQVHAINPQELSNIIEEGKGFWKGLLGSDFQFSKLFIEKLSGEQINQLFSDHTGEKSSWFKNFDSYFSPYERTIIDRRKKEYDRIPQKEWKSIDDARVFAEKESSIEIGKANIESSVEKMTKYIEDVQAQPDLSEEAKKQIENIVQYAIHKKKYGIDLAEYLKNTKKLDLYDNYWHYQDYDEKKVSQRDFKPQNYLFERGKEDQKKGYIYMVGMLDPFMKADFENTIYRLVFGAQAAEFLKNITPGQKFAKDELSTKAKEFNIPLSENKHVDWVHNFKLAAEMKARKI